MFFILLVIILCLVFGGVQNILCCVFCFACHRLVSCDWWCPKHIVLCFLFCLSSSCVLCLVVSKTYCVVFFVLLVIVLCLVFGGVQTILCCAIVFFVFILCLVYLMLPISLDCPFTIAPVVFTNVDCINETIVMTHIVNINKQ